jgi:hypothetical protein
MRGLVTFALGFVCGASLVTLVVGVWFNQPDPAMSTASALEMIAYLTVIGCLLSVLVFCGSCAISKRRPSSLRCFIYGFTVLSVSLVLTALAHQLLPDAPWTTFAFIAVASAAIPWLGNTQELERGAHAR